MPWPPNGSLNVSGSCLTIFRCLYKTKKYIYIHNKRETKHSFRLPFVGHDIPWKRIKIGPKIVCTPRGKLAVHILTWKYAKIQQCRYL